MPLPKGATLEIGIPCIISSKRARFRAFARYIGEIEGVHEPVCIMWGDQDHAAPAKVLDTYRAIAPRIANLELHIFPGILHGYMMPAAGDAFDKTTRDFSMSRAKAALHGLRNAGATPTLRQAS